MDGESMRKEALSRMKALTEKFGLNPNLFNYLEQGELYYSYRVSGWAWGCIDKISYDPNYAEVVDRFQKESGSMVYHAIESRFKINAETSEISSDETPEEIVLLTMLFVSQSAEDWDIERIAEEGYCFAYVENITEKFGEYGDVVLTSDGSGALLRMW